MTQRRSFGNSDGISLGSAKIRVLTGTGSPEASVTAPVGSLYLRSDGGASTALYIKETGTGNTGWTAAAAGQSQLATKLYDNTLGSNGAWNIQNSDLITGTFAAFERLELHLFNIRGTVAATSDALQLLFGTGGGALDSTAGNYSNENVFYENATVTAARGDNNLIAVCAAASAEADVVSDFVITVFNPGSAKWKNSTCRSGGRLAAATQQIRDVQHVWENTGTIDRIGIRTDNDPTDLLATGSRLVILGYNF